MGVGTNYLMEEEKEVACRWWSEDRAAEGEDEVTMVMGWG